MSTSYPIYRDALRVAAITPQSDNRKTGDMEQLYILPVAESPNKAITGGRDAVVCGDCPLRSRAGGGSGACYVVTGQGPRVVWETVKDKPLQQATATGKALRLGAYGDPAFLPLAIVRKLLSTRKRWTGYTHQWHKRSKQWSKYIMASIDNQMASKQGLTSKELKSKAQAKGYRTFRIIADQAELDADEILCPNYTTGVQCADCGLCDGSKGHNDKRKSIAIIVHGSSKNQY